MRRVVFLVAVGIVLVTTGCDYPGRFGAVQDVMKSMDAAEAEREANEAACREYKKVFTKKQFRKLTDCDE